VAAARSQPHPEIHAALLRADLDVLEECAVGDPPEGHLVGVPGGVRALRSLAEPRAKVLLARSLVVVAQRRAADRQLVVVVGGVEGGG